MEKNKERKKEDILELDENQVQLIEVYGDFIESVNAIRYSFLKNDQNVQLAVNFYAGTNNFEIIKASALIDVPPEKNFVFDNESNEGLNQSSEPLPSPENKNIQKLDYLG